MEWKFEPVGVSRVDSQLDEYFNSDALDDPACALAREDIQNKLDAKTNCPETRNQPVKVKYTFSNPDSPLKYDGSSRWLKGLNKHVNSAEFLEDTSSVGIDLSKPMSFLTIEDFNTTGLVGDTELNRDPKSDNPPEHFYWFIRNVGRSRKKKGNRGRWGIGKIVYPASSEIRTFYSYSVSENSSDETLIGRSVLNVHSSGEELFEPDGYYAEYISENEYWPSPSSSESYIENFKRDFNITRSKGQPGLSLVIPNPKKDITYESLLLAIIKQYYWELMRGSLEVRLSVNGHKDKDLTLNKDNVVDIIERWPSFPKDERTKMVKRIEFSQAADLLDPKTSQSYFELKPPKAYSSVKVRDLFESPEQFEEARRQFQSGKIIAIESQVYVHKEKEASGSISSYLTYLQKDEGLKDTEETFIRDGLTIIGERSLRDKGIRALLLAEDELISEFLGDSENPSHTRWNPSTKHFKGKYIKGPSILEYIKKSPARLATALGRIDERIIEDLLDSIFGVTIDEPGNKPKPKPKPDGPQPPTIPKDIIPSPKRFIISQLKKERGFKISNSENPEHIPDRVIVKAAYEVDVGDGMKSYNPADFDFSKNEINIETSGCTVVSELTKYNTLVIQINDPTFSASATGFDANRDILLKPRAVINNRISE